MRYEPQGLERYANTDPSLHCNRIEQAPRNPWQGAYMWCLKNRDEESAHLLRLLNDERYAAQTITALVPYDPRFHVFDWTTVGNAAEQAFAIDCASLARQTARTFSAVREATEVVNELNRVFGGRLERNKDGRYRTRFTRFCVPANGKHY